MTVHISQGIRIHAAVKSALICANKEHLYVVCFSLAKAVLSSGAK